MAPCSEEILSDFLLETSKQSLDLLVSFALRLLSGAERPHLQSLCILCMKASCSDQLVPS